MEEKKMNLDSNVVVVYGTPACNNSAIFFFVLKKPMSVEFRRISV